MDKQLENQESNYTSIQGNFLFKKLSLSLGVALFSGILTYIVAGIIKNKKDQGSSSEENTKELSDINKENIQVNNLDKIDSGSRIFKVKDSIRNNSERIYWRAKKRFVTG